MFELKNLEVTTNIDALVDKLMRFEESIAVPYGFMFGHPYDVFTMLLLDHPELMHVAGLLDVTAEREGYAVLHVRYALDQQEERTKRLDEMEAACAALAESCANVPYAEKPQRVRDWLLGRAVLVSRHFREADSGYAPIVYGLGSPAAFVEAFQFAAGRLGVPCAPNLGAGEALGGYEPENPWVEVYGLSGERDAFLGCVDIVGDAVRARQGQPVGAVFHTREEMAGRYGASHEAVGEYRALCAGAR